MTAPGFSVKKKDLLTQIEKTPEPILTQEVPSPCENRAGAFHCALAHGDGRGDFFNLSLKSTPTGGRTQDLRSAAGSPNR